MKNKMTKEIKNIKNNSGITLIALVITIIVLIILAGVAISMISGENGILRQAKKAKKDTEMTSIEEGINLAVMAAMMSDNYEVTLKEELEKTFGKEGEGYQITGDAKNGWTITVGDIIKEVKGIESIEKGEEPVIADEEETKNWLYTKIDAEEFTETELSIVGYLGEIPDDGVVTIPSVLTIDGKQENVYRVIGAVFWGVDNGEEPPVKRELTGTMRTIKFCVY